MKAKTRSEPNYHQYLLKQAATTLPGCWTRYAYMAAKGASYTSESVTVRSWVYE